MVGCLQPWVPSAHRIVQGRSDHNWLRAVHVILISCPVDHLKYWVRRGCFRNLKWSLLNTRMECQSVEVWRKVFFQPATQSTELPQEHASLMGLRQPCIISAISLAPPGSTCFARTTRETEIPSVRLFHSCLGNLVCQRETSHSEQKRWNRSVLWTSNGK